MRRSHTKGRLGVLRDAGRRRSWSLGRSRLLGALVLLGSAMGTAHAAAPCDVLASSVHLDGVRLTASETVQGGAFRPVSAERAYEVQPFCRVRGVAMPSPDSAISFEVWIPRQGWNRRLEVVGNDGYAGRISYEDMADGMARGYAVAGGDSGHVGPDADLSFAVGHPEKIVDWGHRSVHAVLGASRPILAAAAGQEAEHSYYFGCSTGGSEGLAEVQRYPGDFDGVVVGAPGNDRVRLNTYFMWMYAANHASGHEIIPAAKLGMVTRAAVDSCDRQQDARDGFFDPAVCRFDPSTLLCRGDEADSCLTPPQLRALLAIYAGPTNPRTGRQLFAGGNVSAEAGWTAYTNGSEPARTDFWRYWVLGNPTWRWEDFDFDRDVAYAEALLGPAIDNANPDLSAFRDRGGKIIAYHGEADPIAPLGDTLTYYHEVASRQPSPEKMDAFYRLFLAPGMGHCHGGAGPSVFGNRGALPPRLDADHDVLAALDRWVTDQAPPDVIVASNVDAGVVTRSRPLCMFPRVARFSGAGDRRQASSWTCEAH